MKLPRFIIYDAEVSIILTEVKMKIANFRVQFCFFMIVFIFNLLMYAPVFASEFFSTSQGIQKSFFCVTGEITLVSNRTPQNSRPVYEITDEKKEKYKLIGPKSILEQIIAIKEYNKLKFKISGQLILRGKKKGIFMEGYEIYIPSDKTAHPLNSFDIHPAMPALPGTSENTIK